MTSATVRRILRRQGMPPEEIRAVLAPSDPIVVRRVLELHRERLGEWFQEQQRLVASIEAGTTWCRRRWSGPLTGRSG